MIIDLKRIFVNDNSSLSIDYALDMSDLEYNGEYPLKKPVTIKGSITNNASLIRLTAEISFDFEAPCDRCGLVINQSHSVTVEKSLASVMESEESDTILLVPDMKLDLDEFIYTEVVLGLPMKHLCNEDCKGICPKCGKNLNVGKCECSFKEIDPRLQALADLLKD